MKLSFSTRYMPDMTLSGYLQMAEDHKYTAVEIYDIYKECFGGEKASFSSSGAFSTKRKLLNTGIAISQLDMPFDISDKKNYQSNLKTAEDIIVTAANINVPFVKVFAGAD